MLPRETLATADVPDGETLTLVSHGRDFIIMLGRDELMGTRMQFSEEQLAVLTLAELDAPKPRVLIGGYGMGFTLRAALKALGSDAGVFVAEIVPEIVQWALGPMRKVTSGCLDDPRVMLVDDDVAMLIGAAREGYDAILLDVDNGPEGLTRWENDRLYSREGLKNAMRALRPGGILAIWSAWPDPEFTVRLEETGFEVSAVNVRARPNSKSFRHVIWFARKP